MVRRLSEIGLAKHEPYNGVELTEAGRAVALEVIRHHRLIELLLAELGVPWDRVHDEAEVLEHHISEELEALIAERLGDPTHDPHGDPIPTREGEFPAPEGQSLLSWPAGLPGVISHIEDEPPALFALLAARGIFAGMRFARVPGAPPSACTLEIEARREELPPELAALIRVRPPLADEHDTPAGACRLSEIPRDAAAEVLALLPGCIGPERSRLLDLGFVPGSRVEHELDSPLSGPAAFRVRGTLIALRKTQALQVLVQPSLA
jgi:DtxR family Mn-dependent transcriptional regulator